MKYINLELQTYFKERKHHEARKNFIGNSVLFFLSEILLLWVIQVTDVIFVFLVRDDVSHCVGQAGLELLTS